MKILYFSSTCSNSVNDKLFRCTGQIPGPAQKYHRLMMEGLALNGFDVNSIVVPPVSRNDFKRKLLRITPDQWKGVHYFYIPILNVPILKHMAVMACSFVLTVLKLIGHRDGIVICDVLNISVTAGALYASKLLNRKNTGIVTDLPCFLDHGKTFTVRINDFIIKQFDSYVFLTKQMNERINTKKAPYVIIEGLADIEMSAVVNDLSEKYENRVCLYAGAIHQIYGIGKLIEAFLFASVEGSELHIYGQGDYEEELIRITKIYKHIRYFGSVPNEQVIEAELKATLLINPRPAGEEFTKYSFPSKNMEYMVSGTPVLTTRLPGMPEEYCEHVYLINDESREGLGNTLRELLHKDPLEHFNKGHEAKAFILSEKNNRIQSAKIIDLIQALGKE